MNDIYEKLQGDFLGDFLGGVLARIAKAHRASEILAAVAFQPSMEMAKAWQAIIAIERREEERLRKDLPRQVMDMATEAMGLFPERRDLIESARKEFEECFKRVSSNPLALSMVETALIIFTFAPPDSETKSRIGQESLKRFQKKGGLKSGEKRRAKMDEKKERALELAIAICEKNRWLTPTEIAFKVVEKKDPKICASFSRVLDYIYEFIAKGLLPG